MTRGRSRRPITFGGNETALVSSTLITLEVLLRPAVDGLAELARLCDFYESLKGPFF